MAAADEQSVRKYNQTNIEIQIYINYNKVSKRDHKLGATKSPFSRDRSWVEFRFYEKIT